MTTKPKTPPPDTDGEAERESLPVYQLHLLTADAALQLLRQVRHDHPGGVEVDAPLAPPTDQVVVGDHAYAGQHAGVAWHFAPSALEMACRVAGWSTVEHVEPGHLRLS